MLIDNADELRCDLLNVISIIAKRRIEMATVVDAALGQCGKKLRAHRLDEAHNKLKAARRERKRFYADRFEADELKRAGAEYKLTSSTVEAFEQRNDVHQEFGRALRKMSENGAILGEEANEKKADAANSS